MTGIPGFKDRLQQLARGRTLSPWLKSLGWTNGDIARVNQGHVPGWRKILALCEREQTDLHWLMTGVGRNEWPIKRLLLSEPKSTYGIDREEALAIISKLSPQQLNALVSLIETLHKK